MEEKLRALLQKGKEIAPSDEFVERSHRMIIGSPQLRHSLQSLIRREILENLKFGASLALAAALVLVVFGSFSYWGNLYGGSQALNEERLREEAKNIDFQIQLSETTYYTESAQEIAVFLGEIDTRGSDTIDDALEITF